MDEMAFDYSSDDWSSTAPYQPQLVCASHFSPDLFSLHVVIGIIIVCLIFIGIIIVTMLRRKRRLDRLRSILLPMYSFDTSENDNWDSELLQHSGV